MQGKMATTSTAALDEDDPYDTATMRHTELMVLLETLRGGDYLRIAEMPIGRRGALIEMIIDRAERLGQALDEIPDYDQRKAANKAA